jgi:hypothetical protein
MANFCKRRYPKSKGAKVLHSIFDDGVARDYITSRKEIYVPEYSALIQDNDVLSSSLKAPCAL